MTFWEGAGGATLLAAGLLVWASFIGVSAFRAGFGGGPLPIYLYLLPAAMTFGGPFIMWFVVPRRRKAKRGDR